jgi:hypothetical protein
MIMSEHQITWEVQVREYKMDWITVKILDTIPNQVEIKDLLGSYVVEELSFWKHVRNFDVQVLKVERQKAYDITVPSEEVKKLADTYVDEVMN